jgi:hypothetical protein
MSRDDIKCPFCGGVLFNEWEAMICNDCDRGMSLKEYDKLCKLTTNLLKEGKDV